MRRERNRRSLVDSALRLVGEEGAAALTVARVTRAIGMGPSGFYAHFKSIEECERAAAEEFRGYLSSHLAPYRVMRDAADVEASTRAYAALMESWLARPDWITLVHTRGYDPSPFGEAIRGLTVAVRDDLAEAIWEKARERGIRGVHVRDFHLVAELCIAQFNTALAHVVNAPQRDILPVARTLAHAHFVVVGDVLARMHETLA